MPNDSSERGDTRNPTLTEVFYIDPKKTRRLRKVLDLAETPSQRGVDIRSPGGNETVRLPRQFIDGLPFKPLPALQKSTT